MVLIATLPQQDHSKLGDLEGDAFEGTLAEFVGRTVIGDLGVLIEGSRGIADTAEGHLLDVLHRCNVPNTGDLKVRDVRGNDHVRRAGDTHVLAVADKLERQTHLDDVHAIGALGLGGLCFEEIIDGLE